MGVLESPRYDKAATTDPEVIALFDKWSFVMDANAWYQVDKRLKISFTAKELLHKDYNQAPAYFAGTRPLDSPRAASPQYYLTLDYAL
jgi:outer membrane cobalamin receptor